MTLTVNLGSALATLNRLANHPLSAWMTRAAAAQKEAARVRIIATKKDPDGKAWAPWQPSTEYQRLRKGSANRGILHDEGTLLASLVANSTPNSFSVTASAEAAHPLQFGRPNMAGRAFLGFGPVSLAQLELDAAIELAKIK